MNVYFDEDLYWDEQRVRSVLTPEENLKLDEVQNIHDLKTKNASA